MTRAVCFDAAGTLIHLTRPVGETYRDVAAAFGVDLDARALERAFRQAWAAAPARPCADGPRADDDKGWWRTLVEQVLASALTREQATAFDSAAYFEVVYAHFAQPGVWQVYADVPAALARLGNAGYRLGVISNFDRRLYPVLAHVGLAECFDAVIISSEVGADKPDPRIFAHALAVLGVRPPEAWHVGDDPRCDWGAEALGLHVFRLERPRHTFADLLNALGVDASG